MQQAETIVLLLGLVAALVVIAQKITLPYPVVLVLAGLALSFVPRLPEVKLNPDIVFYFFLPPLIYPAALFTSWRDFRRNLRPILLLAIGLVLTTMMGVAWVAHSLIPSIPWAAAFALGAIVSPPDAVAATSVIRRLPVPHQIRVVLEGESLVNDATALVALQFAVVALMTGTFSLGQATARFVIVALGGTALGLLIGFIARWIHRHLDDPPVQITISLLTPLAAYLLAERIHVSGILAVVTAGIYLGWHGPIIVSSRFRLPAYAVWFGGRQPVSGPELHLVFHLLRHSRDAGLSESHSAGPDPEAWDQRRWFDRRRRTQSTRRSQQSRAQFGREPGKQWRFFGGRDKPFARRVR